MGAIGGLLRTDPDARDRPRSGPAIVPSSRDVHQGCRVSTVTLLTLGTLPTDVSEGPEIRTSLFAAVLAAAVLTACPSATQRQPEVPDDGIQFAGRIGTQQLNVSDGAPEVLLGDCDPNDGTDGDLCLITHTVGGQDLAFVIENPAALEGAGAVSVIRPPRGGCGDGCDEIRDGAIVELRLEGERTFADGGTLTVREAGDRYAVSFVIRVGGGSLTGRFNVAP